MSVQSGTTADQANKELLLLYKTFQSQINLHEFPHLTALIRRQNNKPPRTIKVNPVSKFETQYQSLITHKTPSGKPVKIQRAFHTDDTDEEVVTGTNIFPNQNKAL